MNKENNLDDMTEANMVEEIKEKVKRKKMMMAIKAMKPGKEAGRFETCAGMISASGEVVMCAMIKHENGKRRLRARGLRLTLEYQIDCERFERKERALETKVDPCTECGERIMAN